MGCVRTVELVQLTFTSSDTVKTQDLTLGQEQGQCVPMFITYRQYSAGAAYFALFDVEIYDNSGTPAVRATRGAAPSTYSGYLNVHVIEFISDIDIQSGSYTSYTGDQKDITITAVTTANAFHVVNLTSTSSGDNCDDHLWGKRFTSTTNLRISRPSAGSGTTQAHWYVVEDTTGGDHFTVEHDSNVLDNTNATESTTISTIDLGKTFLLASTINTHTLWQQSCCVQHDLNATTTYRQRRDDTNGGLTSYVQVVELQADDASVTRGDSDLFEYDGGRAGWQAEYNETISIGSTLSDQCVAHYPCSNNYATTKESGGAAYQGGQLLTMEIITSNTEIYIERDDARGGDGNRPSSQVWYTWEAIDFGEPEEGRRINIT